MIEPQIAVPEEILEVWRRFDRFPMETLTKAWLLRHRPGIKQRSVQEMIDHREKTGASGNCFDLAIWLQHEFGTVEVPSYAVADLSNGNPDHVAVIALDSENRRYLCDLGDLWIRPLLIDTPNSVKESRLEAGLFAGARVGFELNELNLNVSFHRPGGKISRQTYDLTPMKNEELIEAGNISQRNLSRPLVEIRKWENTETVHWEFDNFRSHVSSMSGLQREEKLLKLEDWADRIAVNTGMSRNYVVECFVAYHELSDTRRPSP